MEAVKDRPTDTHEDTETEMTSEKDQTTDFVGNLGIEGLLAEAEDDLTKVPMSHDPVSLAEPRIRMINGVFTARRLDTF